MRIGNIFSGGTDSSSLETRAKRFSEPTNRDIFINDLISLSTGAGAVLRELSASSESQNARVQSLSAQFSKGDARGNSDIIATALVDRGFDYKGAAYASSAS